MTEEQGKKRTIFGAWLWDEVNQRKTSLRGLAEVSGISHGSLTRWAKPYAPDERPELPSRKMVNKLANHWNYKMETIQLLVDQSWAVFEGRHRLQDPLALSAEARLFAERYQNLPKEARRLLWRAAFDDPFPEDD